MPKVSIIVPVYGVEKYIERCARSLFEQTLDDIEYLFIDDCTPDKSIDILKQVLEEYPQRKSQVIIHRMEQNSGQAAVRKWGMLNVTGEYVIHCDSDDWVDTDMYRAMYDKAISEEADVVVCDYASSDGTKHQVHKGCLHTDKEQFIRDMCSMQTSWSACNKLVKTSLLHSGIIYPEGNMGEDMALILQITLKAQKIAYVPKVLYYYYTNPQSITQIRDEKSAISKHQQLKGNALVVLEAFRKEGLYEHYKYCIQLVCWNARRPLWGLIHKSKYRHIWNSTFPELDPYLLINPLFSVADKIRYCLTIIHLYPRQRDRIQ